MSKIVIALLAMVALASAEYIVEFDTVRVNNHLAVTNNAFISGELAVGNDIKVTNSIYVGNNLNVTNDVRAGTLTAINDLYAGGDTWLSGQLTVTKACDLYGGIYGGSMSLTNALEVDGVATFNARTDVYGYFYAQTNIYMYGTLYAEGSDIHLYSWDKLAIGYEELDTWETLPEYISSEISQSGSNLTAELVADMARAYYIGGTNYLVEKNTYSGSTNRIIGFRRGYAGAPPPPPDPTPQVWEDIGTLYMDRETVYDWYYYLYGDQAEHANTDTYHWTGEAIFFDIPYAVFSSRMSASTIDAGSVYANAFVGDGSGLTNVTAAQVGAVTPGEASNIVIAVGIAQGWSTNTSWTWQGAQIVAAETSAYSIAYGGPAAWSEASNRFDLLPYSTTNYGSITGSVTITMTSNAYLSSIGGAWHIKTVSGTTPQVPVFYSVTYETSTSAVLSAWCSTNPADATSDYYAYFSNMVVFTYDRPGMTPYQYTNDAAGIVARVDPLPGGNTDGRRVVNSDSLSAAIAAAKPDIAKEAWAYMPSGARQPTYDALTIDKPIIQQSAGVTFVQSGDYFAQSYVGTWDATVTGSVWRVGPSGLTALEIASTNINLAITAFTVRTNVATFVIATNGVVGAPYIQQCADLMAPQWLYVSGQSVTDNATNWTATCSTVATMRFFRAISPGGANKITSAYSHVFNAGISDGTNDMASRSLYVVTNANGSGCTITGFFSVTP
jgi:hypothetical protein